MNLLLTAKKLPKYQFDFSYAHKTENDFNLKKKHRGLKKRESDFYM